MTVAPHRHGLREGTAAAWTAANPILGVGEEGRETDTGQRKVGDGLTHWNDLAYDSTGGGGSGVSSFNSRVGAVTLTKADVTDTGLAKGDVGLGNVDNTADTAKPVSTAQQTALNLKANLASPTFTGTPAAPTAAQGTNTTQLATTAYVQTEAGLLIPKSLVDAKGDLLVGTADNTIARLAAGANGTVPTYDSSQTSGLIAKFPSRSISDTHTDTTASNTTAETVVATQAIPTTAAAGDLIRLVAWGDMLNNTGSNVNYTWKMILGATTALATAATGVAAGANRRQWRLVGEMLVVATNDVRLNFYFFVSNNASTGWVAGAGLQFQGRATATEDLTAGKDLKFSVTMGTASANADFVCHESVLEVAKR